ncbi:MAG: SET domain-containing protein-lysine N-methyltransferase [Desulfobulbaceae bacterium]|nr:MAG: SET domain-containing protein-lysine N-methyltransferase [Desulfobulbaceae bacterium]
MLTVETYLAPSRIHGIGLFAGHDIPAGAVVWKFQNVIDMILAPERFLALCRSVDTCTLQHLMNATYRRNNHYFYVTDNARFINHCREAPNIGFVHDFAEVALRHIRQGEELLEDYTQAYDTSDFFFSEASNPDPYSYLQSVEGDRCVNA